ncbi:unnamed protein product [Adineta ricciae]|uniref:tRNA pseudouridine(55) synthase n=1 Tax=Adineta ricciae TaxID=249248 RepID=A0A814B7K8_ADIRI|nr:unnamed protein product [Adineta ricciae]
MTTNPIMATNAYRLFVNRLCRSCPMKEQCSLFKKFIEQQERNSLESTPLNHSEVQTIDNHLTVSSSQHCFLCLDVLHRYTSDEFIQQIKQTAQSTTSDFQSFCCNLTLPLNLFIRHAYLLKFLNKYVGECNEKDLPIIKDQWRNVMIDRLEEALERPYQIESPFEINITFDFSGEAEELNFLRRFRYADNPKLQKSNANEAFTRQAVTSVLNNITFEDFEQYYKPVINGKTSCTISAQHDSVYIAGRYNKYSRTLSQTPWIIDGIRKADTSVEELIALPISKLISAKHYVFLSSGREDVDVRTLGRGRPFVIEFRQPSRILYQPEEFHAVQDEINTSTKDVRVRDLQQVSKEDSNQIKEGEEEKTKCYEALCYTDTQIDQEELDRRLASVANPLVIEQKTPIRVLHRRTVMTRQRSITELCATSIDAYHFRLRLTTQAGAYVKEFVHGDFGRTKPNLTMILDRFVDILELDVLAVNIDFPPMLEIENEQDNACDTNGK